MRFLLNQILRGKTTTMNLYTGNTAATASLSATQGITNKNCIYQDVLHHNYPVWLDTVGLDHGDANINNSDLVKSYLMALQSAKVRWVHALIWCITPECKVGKRLVFRCLSNSSIGWICDYILMLKIIVEIAKSEGTGGGDQVVVWQRGGEHLGECHHHRQAGDKELRAVQLPGDVTCQTSRV